MVQTRVAQGEYQARAPGQQQQAQEQEQQEQEQERALNVPAHAAMELVVEGVVGILGGWYWYHWGLCACRRLGHCGSIRGGRRSAGLYIHARAWVCARTRNQD